MREIKLDSDTRIYYIYEDKTYYIENKETTTPRTTAEEALKVLKVIAGETPVDINGNAITEDRLIELATVYETLTSLSYNWDDTCAYIKTIQLNSFDKHPITIDCEKSKIYIMNTEYVFDLTLTEGFRTRIEIMQLYFKDTLGLALDIQELSDIYELLTTRYNSTPYNVITTPTEQEPDLKYSNIVKLSNFRNNSPAVYTITFNPYNNYTPQKVANILQIQNNAILLSTTAPSELYKGQKINISNTSTTVDTTTYTADGEYIIKDIDGDLIYTTENLSSPYIYQPPTLFATAYKTPVLAVDRDEQSITLSDISDASYFEVGDSVVIQGTIIPTDYENLTVDGTYTIQGIEDNIIYVTEAPATNYQIPDGATTYPYIYKPIQAGIVNTITNTNIILEAVPPSFIQVNSEIMVSYPNSTGTPTMDYTTVSGIDDKTLTISSSITNFAPNFGELNKLVPYPETLITIEDTTNSNLLPNGSFMVDNFSQVNPYLQLLPNLTLTNQENYDSLNTAVPQTYSVSIGSVEYMTLKGIYSKIYSE